MTTDQTDTLTPEGAAALAKAIDAEAKANGKRELAMLTDDDRELRAWTESGKAPAGSCPFCASRISMIHRDGLFRARCSHRGCGATGPKMRSITRAADLFCCPPQRTAGGTAIDTRPSTGTEAMRTVVEELRSRLDSAAGEADATGPFAERVTTAIREHFETAWSQTRGLLASWESIADDLRTLYRRADDALDSISTAVGQFKPDVKDPFVAHVLAVLTARDSAGPLPALLSDVTMGG